MAKASSGNIQAQNKDVNAFLAVAKLNPFCSDKTLMPVPFGKSVRDILLQFGITQSEIDAGNINVTLDGIPLNREYFIVAKPKGGNHLLNVIRIPAGGGGGQGGGKNIGQLVLSIALIAFNFAVGFGVFGALTSTLFAVTFSANLIGALAISGLTKPPSQPNQEAIEQRFSLTNVQNALKPYQPVPRIYGKRRVFPPLGAKPFTELVGEDQYLRVLYVVGYGPLELSEMKIGDTDIKKFQDVQVFVNREFLFTTSTPPTPAGRIILDSDNPDDITVADDNALDQAGDFTLEAKFRLTKKPSVRSTIVWKGENYRIYVTSNMRLIVKLKVTHAAPVSASEFVTYQSNVNKIDLNTDYHVAMIVDITSSRFQYGSLRIILNGHVLETTELTQRSVAVTIATGTDVLLIGKDSDGNGFDGNIREVRLWNTVRTVTEIGDNEDRDFTIVPAELVGYWKITEGSGLTATDSAVAGNNGTITTATWEATVSQDQPENPFANIVLEEPIGIALKHGPAGDTPIDYIRETKSLTEFISIDIAALEGQFRINGSGNVSRISYIKESVENALTTGQDSLMIQVDYRLKGDSTWITAHTFTLEERTQSPIRKGFGWRTPAPGTYEVRIRRLHNDVQDDPDRLPNQPHKDRYTWTVIRSWRFSDPIQFDKELTTIALRIRATDQLSGTLDNFNCIAESVLAKYTGDTITAATIAFVNSNPDTITDSGSGFVAAGFDSTVTEITVSGSTSNDGTYKVEAVAAGTITLQSSETLTVEAASATVTITGWTRSVTRNPAWHFVDALTGTANARAVNRNTRLQLAQIKTWADNNDTNSFTFDGILDQKGSVLQRSNDIASIGRASLDLRDGKYSVVEDKQQTTIVQHVTPLNSSNYTGTKVFRDLPHALRTRFINPDRNWEFDEKIIYDDGFNSDGTEGNTAATKFEILELPSVTDTRDVNSDNYTGMAYKISRYFMRVGRLRPEEHSFDMDIEYLVFERGDLIRFTHDVPQFGLSQARVESVTMSGGDNTGVVLDAPVTFGADSYAVRMRKSDSTSILKTISNPGAGDNDTITYNSIIASGNPMPVIGDLVLFGVSGSESRELIVRAIEPREDLTARITCIDHDGGIFNALADEVSFDPGITTPPTPVNKLPPAPQINSIRSDEDVLLVSPNNNSLMSRILIRLQPVQSFDLPVVSYQAQFKFTDNSTQWVSVAPVPADRQEISLLPVEDGQLYDFRIRSVSEFGKASLWTTGTHRVIGKTTLPPDVNLINETDDVISWAYDFPPRDFKGFRVRYLSSKINVVWELARPLFDHLVTDTRIPKPDLSETTIRLLVKAEDVAGNQSKNAVHVTFSIPPGSGNSAWVPESNFLFGEFDLAANTYLDEGAAISPAPFTQFQGRIQSGTINGTNLEGSTTTTINNKVMGKETFWPLRAAGNTPWIYYNFVDYELDPTIFDHFLSEISEYFISIVSTHTTANNGYMEYHREVDKPIVSTDMWQKGDIDIASAWPKTRLPMPRMIKYDGTDKIFASIHESGGPNKPEVVSVRVLFHAPKQFEQFQELDIAVTTGTRVTLTNTYRNILSVNVSHFASGTGVRAEVVDNGNGTAPFTGATGPLIKVYDSGGSVVAGKVNVEIVGY